MNAGQYKQIEKQLGIEIDKFIANKIIASSYDDKNIEAKIFLYDLEYESCMNLRSEVFFKDAALATIDSIKYRCKKILRDYCE
jgi:hypothetical protein